MLSFITVIKRSGPDANGNIYSPEVLKKIVEIAETKEFIPGCLNQSHGGDVNIDNTYFSTKDLIYEDKKGGRIRAHVEMIKQDPEVERMILAAIKSRSAKFGPCILANIDENRNVVDVRGLVSIDLILNEGTQCLEVIQKSEQKSSDSKTE